MHSKNTKNYIYLKKNTLETHTYIEAKTENCQEWMALQV